MGTFALRLVTSMSGVKYQPIKFGDTTLNERGKYIQTNVRCAYFNLRVW